MCIIKDTISGKSTKQMLSILWVYFEDIKIGQQWRYRYKRFYNLGIDKTWTYLLLIAILLF